MRPNSLDVFSDWIVETYPTPLVSNPMDDRDVELGEVVPGSAGPLSTSGLLSSNSSRPGTGFTEAGGELIFLEEKPNQLISIKICIDFRACLCCLRSVNSG